MRFGTTTLRSLVIATLIAGAFFALRPTPTPPLPTLGDAEALEARYQTWRSNVSQEGIMPIHLSEPRTNGHGFAGRSGVATVDLHQKDLTVELSEPTRAHIWLVTNVPGSDRSALPEPEDRWTYLGRTDLHGHGTWGSTELAEASMLVGTADRGEREPLFSGSLSVFQKTLLSELEGARSAGWSLNSSSGSTDLEALVAAGELLFTTAEFDGNGRTCATCHRPTNNFTIDPAFIRSLPPTDPLFVAEFTPALDVRQNGGFVFEDPEMMRRFALIVANVDGTEDLANKYTLRSVPHTLGMSLSITPSSVDGTTSPPNHRTGWSGDGAPGDGTLREFAIGAVRQHFTKTLARDPISDFRLPTEAELDALELFQLSLGRSEELDLEALELRDQQAAQGLIEFLGPGKCNGCHLNAGAGFVLDPAGNGNFDTGVEQFRRPRSRAGVPIPRDGGFGTEERPRGGFGDGTFNSPSLVEAADTAPYFHNNSAETLEDAVSFYNSRAFNDSPAAQAIGGIRLDRRQVRRITHFLRVVNCLENVRESEVLLSRVGLSGSGAVLARTSAEIQDALDGLDEGDDRRITTSVRERLQQAARAVERAREFEIQGDFGARDERVARALVALSESRSFILGPADGLASNDDGGRRRDRRDDTGSGRPPRDGDEPAGGPDAPPPPGGGARPQRVSLAGDALTPADSELITLPSSFSLSQNFPNPFNPTTSISFAIPEASAVSLDVFDVLGRHIVSLADGSWAAGSHTVQWDGQNSSGQSVPSGTYVYRLASNGASQTKVMALLK